MQIRNLPAKFIAFTIMFSLLMLLVVSTQMWLLAPVFADTNSIKIKSSKVTSEFPNGFRFLVEASSNKDIVSIVAHLKIGHQTSGTFNYLCDSTGEKPNLWRCNNLRPSNKVDGELLWRTNTASTYIPPETLITYNFEIEDTDGNTLETTQQEFVYRDIRYQWKELTRGPVTVAYHGPVLKRATIVLDTVVETIDAMAPLLGAEAEGEIRVALYNNNLEMLGALPKGSTTIRRELITEGQAFFEMGVLLMLGGGTRAKGTASHEVTHILVHRAADSVFRRAPSWIQEGLAEYANVDPGFSYEIALQFATATNRLLPVLYMGTIPGNPEDVMIFYGQSRSIVRMMIDKWGIKKMNHLMATMKSGKDMDAALSDVYGLNRQGLDDIWRDSLGAPRYVPQDKNLVKPTPIPQTVLLPFSLTPHAGAEVIGSKSSELSPDLNSSSTNVFPKSGVTSSIQENIGTEDPQVKPKDSGTGILGCNAAVSESANADPLAALMLVSISGLAAHRRRL